VFGGWLYDCLQHTPTLDKSLSSHPFRTVVGSILSGDLKKLVVVSRSYQVKADSRGEGCSLFFSICSFHAFSSLGCSSDADQFSLHFSANQIIVLANFSWTCYIIN